MPHAAELLMLGKAQTQTGEHRVLTSLSDVCKCVRLSGNISRKNVLWFSQRMDCQRI